jgi:hypothetical protein
LDEGEEQLDFRFGEGVPFMIAADQLGDGCERVVFSQRGIGPRDGGLGDGTVL